jgi:transcriptional regulator of heat shock response
LNALFFALDTALKKYHYLNPDKKVIKEYLDDLKTALMNDTNLAILIILKEIKESIENNKIDLKDKKKEQCIESIEKLTMEYLKDMQSKLLKLENQKQRSQTKITHNSASLNLSEQQYWINATEDKLKYHKSNIEKLEKNINSVDLENAATLIKIRTDLEKLMDKNIELKDDLTQGILSGEREFNVTN